MIKRFLEREKARNGEVPTYVGKHGSVASVTTYVEGPPIPMEIQKPWAEARLGVNKRRLRAESLYGRERRWYVWKLWDDGKAECTSGLLSYAEALASAGKRRDEQPDASVASYSYWPGTDIVSALAQSGRLR